ncbi:AAA family ATPase [Bradyrhizobium lablabi]|nr:AAA family ATPase [Bradyrhizobium lablabi]
MDQLSPPVDRLAYIGRDVSLAQPGEKLSVFVDRANAVGGLVRDGFLSATAVSEKLWQTARAHNLVGSPGSELEEHITNVIEGAVALADEDEPPMPAGPDDYGGHSASTAPSDQSPLALVTPQQWKGVELEPMRWLATHRVPADDVTILSGDGGLGKTTVALQLGVSVARNLGDWLGTTTLSGPVIFFSAEEPESEMRRRLDRVARKRGIEPEQIEHLYFHFAEPDKALLGISTPAGTIAPTATFQALARSVTDVRPALLIVDSVAAVFGGNQNDRVQARTFVSMFRRLAREAGCAIVLLDHPSLSGMNSGTGRGGNMDWSNVVRSRLYLRTVEEEEAAFRELEVVKSNYGPAGEKVRLRWEDGSFVLKTVQSTPQQAATFAKIDDLFLKLLDKRTAQGRRVYPTKGSGYAPSVFAIDPDAAGITPKALATSMERLFSERKIVTIEEGPPSKRVTRIARAEVSKDG